MPATPSIGPLRHRIYIEYPTAFPVDSFNEPTPEYTLVAERWASIEDKRGEGLQVQQADTRAELNHAMITFRWFHGLTVNHRLRYGVVGDISMTAAQLEELTAAEYAELSSDPYDPATYFRIVAINDPERRRKWQVCDCVQVTG